MGEAAEDDVLQSIELLLDPLIYVGIGVAEDVDPPGADRIQIAVAIEIVQPYAFAPLDRDYGHVLVVLHLGAGVPEYRQVPLHPLIVQPHFSLAG